METSCYTMRALLEMLESIGMGGTKTYADLEARILSECSGVVTPGNTGGRGPRRPL